MSKNHIKISLDLNPETEMLAYRNLQPGGRAQKFVDSEVLRCSDKYVPFYLGPLKKSGQDSTVIGSGMVHYDTPYARKNYYENRGMGTDGVNKGAGLRGRLWFERMKRDHLKGIRKGVKKLCGAK